MNIFNKGITKEQILQEPERRQDIVIEELRIGEMIGSEGKIFAHSYPYPKSVQDAIKHINEEKKDNPNYDFVIPKSEPYKGHHSSPSQFNFNNIRHADLRGILDAKAEKIKIINREKALPTDKKINPHRVWAISAEGMFERTKALRRWLDKNGYASGINSVSFFNGGSNRDDDPDSPIHYHGQDSYERQKKEGQIPNVQTVIYWKDDVTKQQKQKVQAIFSSFFDMDLNSEYKGGADFADADVRATAKWREKLNSFNENFFFLPFLLIDNTSQLLFVISDFDCIIFCYNLYQFFLSLLMEELILFFLTLNFDRSLFFW